MNENYKKFFSFETLNKLLQCKSNIESNFFKLQLFTTKMYRQSTFRNIPHILLINENMSFINRQLFCSSGTIQTEILLKAIIPFRANDITTAMNLFRKIENNIGVVKTKKENQMKIVKSLEKIVEKIFSYFNDNKFVFGVKESDVRVKYDYSFLASSPYNKELLSTLFNFDEVDVNENEPFINGINFYDNLLAENDSYAENIDNFLNTYTYL